MDLSNDLISQFVKVTRQEKQKKESTVYGSIVVGSVGKQYVKLDGSEVLTPIDTTVDAANGDRVIVMIKDHKAVVTGNISSPSARNSVVKQATSKIDEYDLIVANKVDTELFNAQVARIDNLVSENVTIKGQLTADEADIASLQAGNATITEKVTAAEADIDTLKATIFDAETANVKFARIEDLEATDARVNNLEATYGEFHDLAVSRLDAAEADIDRLEANKLDAATAEITYAKISDLNATNANIDNLEADVAEIDTLIFGVASGNVIQTSFANAVIAQLGDAQIKSAMIESVYASKITSGDIITNNVRVMSEDGKLLISDETIQISDNTRVRVQIGKDASGDYSISIWDASGNLMFSEGGITDSAIKNAIIRNDMVSDTANISAHKLDIDTLFEVINGSSNTIKSTRVYLDDESQTLDVAFKELTTEVNDLESTVSSHGTQLDVVQGQITSKIWQEDIANAVNELSVASASLSDNYSELEQELDSISATVASHTTTLETKADSSSVTEVDNKVTALEANLSGFQSSVSSKYATKTEVSEVQNDVTNLEGKSASAETKIAQHDSSIDSLVNRTTVVENKFAGYSTTEEMNSAISQSANSISSSVSETYATKTEFKNLEIGGRNLIAGTDDEYEYVGNASGSTTGYKDVWSGKTISIPTGSEYVVSFDAKADVTQIIKCYFYSPNTTTSALSSTGQSSNSVDGSIDVSITSEWVRYWVKWTQTTATTQKNVIVGRNFTGNNIYIRAVKFESGNKPTDWTPAPEDMATADGLATVQSSSDLVEARVSTAESLIEQLSDSLAILITDGNGESLMVQTENGWTFSTGEIQSIVESTSENLGSLTNEMGNVNSTVTALQQAVADLGVLNDYVKIGTYESEPCIELGEYDSDFKLLITNTRIMFMEGSGVPAYISNQSLYIKKSVIEEELQQGQFIWKARSNGNLGLIWKGVVS